MLIMRKMCNWVFATVASVSAVAFGQQATVFAVAPETVQAGDSYTVEVHATLAGYGAGAALAGYGLSVLASGDAGAIAGVTEPSYGAFNVGTLAGRVDGPNLTRVVGGQLPHIFGLNPGVVTATTVKLFEFVVTTEASAQGQSITYTPALASTGGVVVYPSSTAAANVVAPVQSFAGITTAVVSACTGDFADDFGTIGSDGQVSFGDFLALLGLIGPCPGGTGCVGDIADDFGTLGADGQVSFGDFLALLGLIGPCP